VNPPEEPPLSEPPNTSGVCPSCGAKIRPAVSAQGNKFLSCERFPRCGFTLCADALTVTRARTHLIFDQVWKQKIMTRTSAYLLMRRLLNLSEDQAHISRLSITQCHKLIHGLRGLVEVDG
jgi:ssDNA-binding Zn-finger/Zn-ribbon topoisomerase 1